MSFCVNTLNGNVLSFAGSYEGGSGTLLNLAPPRTGGAACMRHKMLIIINTDNINGLAVISRLPRPRSWYRVAEFNGLPTLSIVMLLDNFLVEFVMLSCVCSVALP